MFRANARIALVALLLTLGVAHADTPPLHLKYAPSERSVTVKDPIGYRIKSNGEEGDFLARYRREYIVPRAFPKAKINTVLRQREYLALRERRLRLKMPHINAGFSSGPQPGGGDHGGGGSPGGRDSNGLAWHSVGPTNVNGRVTQIAVDPNNHNRLFVSTVGGVWRSTDQGRTWQCITDDFLAQVFASVAFDPDGSEIVAGTGDPNYQSASGIGIWRSIANGDPGSWAKVSPPALDNEVIYRLRYDPAAPHDIYAATSNGIYVGTHSAATITWTRLGGFDAHATDMAVDFSVSPHLVYAGVYGASATYGKGLWKYDGSAWHERDSGIPVANGAVWALALAPSAHNTLYAKLSKPDGHLLDVFKTTNAGEGANAWAALNANSLDDSCAGTFCYSWYNSIVEVDPTDANTVYAGGLSPWVTHNGGTSWTLVNKGTDASYPVYTHSDHHAFAFDTNHNIVYAGDDGGIFRSTDVSSSWHWNDISHGMVITQFYHGANAQAAATLYAGGSQDNGTEITFGNRTWYPPGGCDGSDVAVDAADADTLFANCNGGLYEFANPVPGTGGGGTQVTMTLPAGLTLVSPLVSNDSVAHAALSAGNDGSTHFAATTSDNVAWAKTSAIPGNAGISFLASAPSSASTLYAGLYTPTIVHSTNGGTTWVGSTAGLPNNLAPNAIAIDAGNSAKAVAVFGGFGGAGVFQTTDTGQHWTSIAGSGSSAIPNVPLTGVVMDPTNANVLYVSSTLGVFKGTLSGSPATAAWVPFDEGIPDGLDVNTITVNRVAKTLGIATFGHGTYERDIDPSHHGGAAITVVRDTVSDSGIGPSLSNIPDPEHPIADSGRPGFYKPNDSPGGRLYWWTSPDIRIDVPNFDPPANTIANADSVEMETCPTEISACPPGSMIDSNAQRGKSANVYVHVANAGLAPASNVRVIALFADATTAVPPLPNDFWSTTFPAAGACGALNTGTGWHLPDPAHPCVTIPVVNPEYPRTAKFSWSVSATQAEHSCMLVVIESADDPLPADVRANNIVDSWQLVPQNHQIAQRNLHIVDSTAPGAPASGSEGMNIPNYLREKAIELVFDRSLLPEKGELAVFLPRGAGKIARGFKVEKLTQPVVLDRLTEDYAKKHDIDLLTQYRVEEHVAELPDFPAQPGNVTGIVLHYSSGPIEANSAARFSILQRQGGIVVGGSTYVLRSRGEVYVP